ncbi:unnamed protein product [Acanthoscelides obtectus]|uniref:Uncharacterized protein n=1 Tax=Acanthoscelides obtectus TaxID=200917 RepID=A0A9P0L1J7_ACAOB|nr:unnamed protein product [Acanthoscelides obtectus]CAK1637790.1 hypothetical protein AOBTE_LOCUS10197 [Acanthoscelides obtectus]
MVRNYVRKTDRGGWTEEQMKNAVLAVVENKMGYYLDAKSFEVPQTTLERKVRLARENMDNLQKLKVPLGPKSRHMILLSSETTNINLVQDQLPQANILQNPAESTNPRLNENESNPNTSKQSSSTQSQSSSPQPGCSFWNTSRKEQLHSPTQNTSFALVSPKQLLPPPVTTKKNRIQTRKKGTTAVITSSPYKEELEKELQEKQQKGQLKVKRNIDRQMKKEEKQKIIEETTAEKKQQNQISQKGKRPKHDNEDDTSCLYCSGLYSES